MATGEPAARDREEVEEEKEVAALVTPLHDGVTNTPRIEVYGTEFCSFCAAARMLLERKGVAYEDISVSGDPAKRAEMQQRSGRRTVPQIFIDGRPIGGFDELRALEASGELDALLGFKNHRKT